LTAELQVEGGINIAGRNMLLWCIVRLQMVEDAVPGKQLNEMEEKRQELIGE